jgi:hypothetical protein
MAAEIMLPSSKSFQYPAGSVGRKDVRTFYSYYVSFLMAKWRALRGQAQQFLNDVDTDTSDDSWYRDELTLAHEESGIASGEYRATHSHIDSPA